MQSKSVKFKCGNFWAKYQGYSLTFGQIWLIVITFQCPTKISQVQMLSLLSQKWLIFITFQCAIKINQFKCGHFWAKYQGYSLTFRPSMAHSHHFSICNQNQSSSNVVTFQQNTKAIALLFGQKCLIFITFQCAIKINHFQIWSFLSKIPRL